MNEWHDLFVATAGASAALTALIFVGLSINLETILSFPHLPGRASISLSFLSAILIVSIILLIPAQSYFAIGIEVLTAAILCYIITVSNGIAAIKQVDKRFKKANILKVIFDQLCILPYITGSVFFISGSDHGYYWIVAAFIFSFIKAITDAWVLLVEIKR